MFCGVDKKHLKKHSQYKVHLQIKHISCYHASVEDIYVCHAVINSLVMLICVVELVPYFTQNPVSYMSYPPLNDAYLDFDVEMSFAPETTDGKQFLL